MIHSPRRHSSSGQGKHSLFPGAKAKNKDGLNNKSPNADAEEGHASGGADDGESLVIAHEDGSIFSDSADSRPGSDKDDGRCYNSEEPIPAAPEPKLDWAGLEERKLALEDGRATVSSSLASGDEDEASEYEAPSPASDAQGMPAALSSRGPSR
ncbi:hypothetical protein IJT17_02300, partial [bacterium]|nr:hypothetical protein [bacterium]